MCIGVWDLVLEIYEYTVYLAGTDCAIVESTIFMI